MTKIYWPLVLTLECKIIGKILVIIVKIMFSLFCNFHGIILFCRHRHSLIGNNLEKLPRSESNLTRYQTSLALDQVEHKGTVVSNSSSFNIKYAESRGATAENVLIEKNRGDEKDNNEKRSKKNIQLEKITVRIFHTIFHKLIF